MGTPATDLAGPKATTYAQFFAATPAAHEFVATWKNMRALGTTDWSIPKVVRHLRTAFGCPLTSQDAFRRWLDR